MTVSHRLIFTCILIILSFPLVARSQPGDKSGYRVVFYNAENLFDPFDDPATRDSDFTPNGKNHWNMNRLNEKVMMVYRAIVSASHGTFPDIIGLAEIENLWIVEYLIRKTPLKEKNYGIIHKESPDFRGIDVALLYRKETVKPLDYNFIPIHGSASNPFISRDVLFFKAKLDNEPLHFVVNHWPSRSGGYVETKSKREITAEIVRQSLDSLLAIEPHGKFLLMGDFNATPDESCFLKTLGAAPVTDGPNNSKFYNLSWLWMKGKTGTIRTKGKWEIFDQFICSEGFLYGEGLILSTGETSICTAGFLLEEDARYLGTKPFRTFLGPVYHGGISDHLPISTRIIPKKSMAK